MLMSAALLLAGCGGQPKTQAPQAVEVSAMQVIQRDTPITYEYVGQVKAQNEVQIRSNVSGNIVAKMVTGGASVSAGQALFQIDRRQYEASLLNAQAQLAQSEAQLSNSHLDSLRYQKLASQNAIAQQTVDTQLSTERQNAAAANAYRAKVQQAADDLSDTLIVAPFSGRIDMSDLSVGNYVAAGSTTLATMSSVDPIFVQFSMSENEYLKFSQAGDGSLPADWGNSLKLLLSDGSQYPLSGHIEQVDRGLATDTGTLTIKAAFENPQKLLIPGMFARVQVQGGVRRGALLIPQRAVQQLLGKTFVTVVGEGDKAVSRPVTMGPRVGDMWIVEDGLITAERVVVEGFAKAQPGSSLKVSMMDRNEAQLSQ
ncbi:MAG: efflux RND transporter periplasmic adaptor subunit [Negativicutes bacterium]|nr:efflux RND transporter periplasmic adaptor subunit [Negativicutes bacterium]